MNNLPFLPVGDNAVRVFGLLPAERVSRFAVKAGLRPVTAAPSDGPLIVADLGYAWDPLWLRHVVAHPGLALTLGGRLVLAHVVSAGHYDVIEAMREGRLPPAVPGLTVQPVETMGAIENRELRKREPPYLMPLDAITVRAVEKASYDGAYKGVTDVLTLYLWRGIAFHLTRWAAAIGLSPNMVTAIGAALCVAATGAFYHGHYWAGIAMGLTFMVLDTVDGKLARCTGTSSAWGNVFDHGIDLVHPPFWWWAWGVGLVAYGTPLPEGWLWPVLWVIVIGYVVQRLIEGAFIKRFGMHIHVWQRFDSWFRLYTARRNPNMVILFFALIAGRPDIGLVLVAVWTVLSCLVHFVRLLQAMVVARRSPILSWLQ